MPGSIVLVTSRRHRAVIAVWPAYSTPRAMHHRHPTTVACVPRVARQLMRLLASPSAAAGCVHAPLATAQSTASALAVLSQPSNMLPRQLPWRMWGITHGQDEGSDHGPCHQPALANLALLLVPDWQPAQTSCAGVQRHPQLP
jgi:hypothetical protein